MNKFPYGIRTKRITLFELMDSNIHVLELLIINGFDHMRPIIKEVSCVDKSTTYYQALTLHDLLFRKFVTEWVPDWKRIKKILHRKYGKGLI